MPEIKVGQKLRRKADGVIVVVTGLSPIGQTGGISYDTDVSWELAPGQDAKGLKTRGQFFLNNLRYKYSLVLEPKDVVTPGDASPG